MFFDLSVLFGLVVFSSVLSNLKTISLNKETSAVRYFVVGFDALVWTFIISKLGKADNFYMMVTYVLGKLIALPISDFFVKRLYKTVYIISLYVGTEKCKEIEQFLFDSDFSYTKFNGNYKSKKQIMLSIQVNREQKNILIRKLSEIGIENPTMNISETKVYGKIKEKVYSEKTFENITKV